jgi:hypothetical protein
MTALLRVGVLLDSFNQPAWVEKVIQTIQSCDFAQIQLVVLNDSFEKNRKSFRVKLWKNQRYIGYRIYSRLDNFFFRLKPDAFARVNLEKILTGCRILNISPIEKKFSTYFPDEALAAISELQPDVMLRFGFGILRGEILKIPKYGIWSYHHGDNNVNRGGPPGFWEVMKNEPATGSVLQILTEDLDAGRVIYRSYARTDKRSVKRNKNNYYWKSAQFVIRKLRDLSCEGPDALRQDACSPVCQPYSHPLYRNPTNSQILQSAGSLVIRNVSDKCVDLYKIKQWYLAYRFHPSSSIPDTSFYRFKELMPPKDRYWADPFPLKHQENIFVFIEEFLYGTKKGHISVLELKANGSSSRPVKILEEKHHLSYPFIFHWNGCYYMIPEAGGSKRLDLYRCTEFPGKWEHEKTLLEGKSIVDATIVQIEDTWWMFANIAVEGASTFDELHLFYSESPLGPWKAHRKNPVKSDCRSSRPAGNLFRFGDAFYRPAQDCSVRYGYAISLNKIIQMNQDNYQEIEVSKIYPKWKNNLLATHTINSISDLTIIDVMIRRRIFF